MAIDVDDQDSAGARWRRFVDAAGTVAVGALVGAGLYLIWRQTAPPSPEERPEPPPRRSPPPPRETGWISGPAGGLFVDSAVDSAVDGALDPTAGGALPAIFVHGLGGTVEHWRPVLEGVERLGPGFRTVGFDLRGHGRSDGAVADGIGVREHAADIGAVADALGLSRFALVGHSMGAHLAIAYAGLHPGRIEGLALVDPSGDSTRQPRDQVEAMLSAVREEPQSELAFHYRQFLVGASDETADRVLGTLAATDDGVLAESLAASMTYDPLPALSEFTGPKIVVTSPVNDLPSSLHRLRPDIRHLPLRDTSHWIMLDRPDELTTLLAEFLASL